MNQDVAGSPPRTYRALSPSTQEIRLLSISNSLHGNLIVCNTQTVSLKDASTKFRFVVLSYRWGAAHASHEIILNGHSFYVRPNLWSFLNVIREQPEMILWIDALCINQNDIEERNQQVRFMGDIFRSARMVLSWLGAGNAGEPNANMRSLEISKLDETPSASIGIAFELMSQVWSSTSHAAEDFDNDQTMAETDNERLPILHTGLTEDDLWQSVVTLCQHPYWERAWVVQEILLSSTNYLLYGATPLPWQIFANFLSLVDVRFHPPTHYSRAILSSTARSYALQKPYSMVPEALQWRNVGGLVRHDSGRNWDRNEFSLFRVLSMFGERGCADPLDHVYALLGLIGEGDRFTIKYGIHTVELLLRVFHFCGNMAAQDGTGGRTSRSSTLDLGEDNYYRPVSQRALMRNTKYLAEILELIPAYQKTSPYFHGSLATARGPSPKPDPCFPGEGQALIMLCTTIEPGGEPPVLRSNTLRRSMGSIPFDILLHLDESSSWLMCRTDENHPDQLILVAVVTIKDGAQGRGFRILEPGNDLATSMILPVANQLEYGKWEMAVPPKAHLAFLQVVVLGVQPD